MRRLMRLTSIRADTSPRLSGPGRWCLLCLLACLSAMASAEEADRWEIGADSDQWGYRGQIYLWGAGIDGDTVSGDDIDIDFGDLTDLAGLGGHQLPIQGR